MLNVECNGCCVLIAACDVMLCDVMCCYVMLCDCGMLCVVLVVVCCSYVKIKCFANQ